MEIIMTHSKEETTIIEKYENSIDPEVLEFVKGVLNGEDRLTFSTLYLYAFGLMYKD